MQQVKNIIFDFGGIFMDVDYNKTEQAFINLGVTNFHELYNQHHANPLFEDLETGKIEPVFFFNEIRKISKLNLTDEQLRTAWDAMLGDFYYDEINWLYTIKSKYNIYLYSNTNKIHHDFFSKKFEAENKGKHFEEPFIKAYYSHTCHFRKPYPASFLRILAENNLKAEETLFIDDTIKNIEGAKQAGLQTMFLQVPKRVSTLVF